MADFAERKLLGGLAKVALGGGVDAVDSGAEIGGVEVANEDFLLVELLLEPQRQHGFLHLALDGALRRKVQHARKLLGDGAAALAPLARQVAPGRAQHRAQIDAAVLVEATVLDCDDGAGQMGGRSPAESFSPLKTPRVANTLPSLASTTNALGVASTLSPPASGRVAMAYTQYPATNSNTVKPSASSGLTAKAGNNRDAIGRSP